MERPVDPLHIIHDRKGFAYQGIFLQGSLYTLDFAEHGGVLHGILIGILDDKVSGGRPSQVPVHHSVGAPHRTVKLKPMDHVVIDPDAGDSYRGDDQKHAAKNGDHLASSHANFTESGKQRGFRGIRPAGLMISLFRQGSNYSREPYL